MSSGTPIRLFEAPLQGAVELNATMEAPLALFCEQVRARLGGVTAASGVPQRVNEHNSLALTLGGVNGQEVHILIAVSGQVAWPLAADYRTSARWVVHVRDTVDALALAGSLVAQLDLGSLLTLAAKRN